MVWVLTLSSPSARAPSLGLPFRMRLYLPAHRHRHSTFPRLGSCPTYPPIPWKVAFLAIHRHTRAFLGPLLPLQLSGTLLGSLAVTKQGPVIVSVAEILHRVWLFWLWIVDCKHGLPHQRLHDHGTSRLLRCWRQRAIRSFLCTDPYLQARRPEGKSTLEALSCSIMDIDLPRAIWLARIVPHLLEMGLHLQHGSKHRHRDSSKHIMDRVRVDKIQQIRKVVAGMAGYDCSLDRAGYEPRGSRFPALEVDD